MPHQRCRGRRSLKTTNKDCRRASKNSLENTPFSSPRRINRTFIEFECNKIINHTLANQKIKGKLGEKIDIAACHYAQRQRGAGSYFAPPANRAFTPMQQYYQGTLPGENREAIKTSLFLVENGTFVMRQHFTPQARA